MVLIRYELQYLIVLNCNSLPERFPREGDCAGSDHKTIKYYAPVWARGSPAQATIARYALHRPPDRTPVRARLDSAYTGTIAVASISNSAAFSTKRFTSTTAMVG